MPHFKAREEITVAITTTKVAEAKNNFEQHPNNQSAALYLSLLSEAEEIGAIDDDEFHNGLADVEAYLWKGGSMVPFEPTGSQ